MLRRGFTIVELIITITIMGILLVLAVVNVSGTQAQARDDERKADVESISLNLESFFKTGPTSGSIASTITNLVPNPSLETNSTGWNPTNPNATVTASRQTVGGYSGSSFYRVLWNTANAGATGGIYYGNPANTDNVAVTAGTQYTSTGYIRSNVSRQLNFGMTWWNAGGASVPGGVSSAAVSIPANVWTRLSVTATAPAGATKAVVYAYITGADWVAGNTLDADAFITTVGPSAYTYSDGSSSGWSWTGTSHGSTSSGPIISTAAFGFYPATALTVSPALSTYLGDADMKSFTAPGQTDPYVTFVAATNAVQTVTGVAPQPTVNQYVYQPINSTGGLCTIDSDCRKFNIYYRTEVDNVIHMITSKSQ